MEIIKTLINGLSSGGTYAMIALGYTMVYGIAKLLNFAHGDIIMVGGYTVYVFMNMTGHPVAAIVAAVVCCVLLGVGIERVAYRPLRGASPLAVIITAIGVSYFLQNAAQLIWGSAAKTFTSIVTFKPFSFADGNLVITGEVVITVAASVLIMIALTFFTGQTRMGKAMRAVSEDRDAAQLMGINVNQTISMTFAIGSALAAIAGVLLCSTVPTLMPTTGSMPGIRAFTAAVIGGIGSIPGAMLGGILLGIIETFSKKYISTEFSDAIVFAVLILILLVRPAGLMGKQVQEKV